LDPPNNHGVLKAKLQYWTKGNLKLLRVTLSVLSVKGQFV
jgi:hypothetical protein